MIEYLKKNAYFIVFILILLALVILKPITITLVNGSSMSPTFETGNVVPMFKYRKPQRGDIVYFQPPKEWTTNKVNYIKRVIGLPGDKIAIQNNILYVNNKAVKQVADFGEYGNREIIVTKDTYFLAGDNFGHSSDSLSRFRDGHINFLVPQNLVKGSISWESGVEEINEYISLSNNE